MWSDIKSELDIVHLMKLYGDFHDSCLVKIEYVSGVYVDENLNMCFDHELGLRMLFQRQNNNYRSIEIEFLGVYELHLCPPGKDSDGIILDASMFYEDKRIYWGDSDWFGVQKSKYKGTWLCAEKARWRVID